MNVGRILARSVVRRTVGGFAGIVAGAVVVPYGFRKAEDPGRVGWGWTVFGIVVVGLAVFGFWTAAGVVFTVFPVVVGLVARR